jgi:hypothetical protein
MMFFVVVAVFIITPRAIVVVAVGGGTGRVGFEPRLCSYANYTQSIRSKLDISDGPLPKLEIIRYFTNRLIPRGL